MKPFWIVLGLVTAGLVLRAAYNRVSTQARKEEMMRDQRTAIALEKATFGAG